MGHFYHYIYEKTCPTVPLFYHSSKTKLSKFWCSKCKAQPCPETLTQDVGGAVHAVAGKRHDEAAQQEGAEVAHDRRGAGERDVRGQRQRHQTVPTKPV